RITPDRIAALETIEGWQWKDDLDAAWWTNFELCCDYVAENHEMPTAKAVYRDINLGKWVSTQRQVKKGQGHGKMTLERIEALETIEGWKWEDDLDAVWWTNFELCCDYVAENHAMPPQKIVYRDVKLGAWVGTQRRAKKGQGGKMTPERIAALEMIECWQWEDDLDAAWWTNFELLCAYVAENHAIPPRSAVYRDVKLGSWVSNQRAAKKGQGNSGKITPDRIAALETIEGWQW
ncbi:MAG: helicase associated domain-containing protein, partial [Gemmatimonadaceae bacterium]